MTQVLDVAVRMMVDVEYTVTGFGVIVTVFLAVLAVVMVTGTNVVVSVSVDVIVVVDDGVETAVMVTTARISI